MVKVDIVLDNARIFLFPASVALGSETNVIPPDDTTVRGEIILTSEEQVRIGPVRVVWEVARELKCEKSWRRRDVLARFESEVTMDDSYLEKGTTRYLFTFQIPSLLPPTTETAFDRTSHTLVASVLDPVPSYSTDTPPGYYDLDTRDSICSLSDWSFPSNASRRSSLLSTPSGSQRSSIDLSRSGWSTPADSRRSSLAIPSSSRSSFSMASNDRPEPRKQKKSLLSGFLRKSSTLSQAAIEEPASEADSLPAPVSCDGIELAEWLSPSTAGSTRTLEVISCPAARGEICTVDWMKGSRTAGLGHSQRYIHSSIFSLGSGVNFDYNLSEIPASSTVHSIRLSLCQTTKASNGNKEESVFTLFSRGTSSEGEHVWRGEVARSWDAQTKKSKGKSSMGPVPQASLPGVNVGGSSLRIRTKARLPTPINGAVPTSPRLLDNRLSRVNHHLRVETFYSVLGEDASGSILPIDPKSKDGRPQEGTIRRTWVDHEVIIGACCLTPENILVPTYSASSNTSTTTVSAEAREQARTKVEDFAMPKACTHTITTERGRRVSEQLELFDGEGRLVSHAQANDSRCLCFHDDVTIGEMIGSLDKPNQNHVNFTQIDVGGIVKSLYAPVVVEAEIEDVVVADEPWRHQTPLVACS